MHNFLSIQRGEKQAISVKISTANEQLAKKNREVIIRLIDIFKYCAERGMALRGHRDDGIPSIDGDDYVNLGNFKSAVASHARHDPLLKEHLESAKTHTYASYLSKYAQADLTKILLEHLQAAVVNKAKNQSEPFMFSVSADEVTDCSNTEQLAIVIRSVGIENKISERLVEYVDMESITGEAIAHAVLSCLKRHELDIKHCRGQTYDGAANMSGALRGCQALISQQQFLALYHHCSSHRLNLALNSTPSVTEFWVMMANVKKLGIFLAYSPKRAGYLQKILEKADPLVCHKKVCTAIPV